MYFLPLPSQARLKEVLDYNEDTGVFRWKIKTNRNIRIGDVAGGGSYYTRIQIDSILYLAHRLAWVYITGEDPGDIQIDHFDENKLNNAFSNLREATNGQNSMNRGAKKSNKLGIKGVYKQRNRYLANIYSNGKKYYLGSYLTPEEAHKAYCEAADKYHGEFANYG